MSARLQAPFGPVGTRLLTLRDSKLRRCWWCGCQNYDRDDCTACAAPADRLDLDRETSA